MASSANFGRRVRWIYSCFGLGGEAHEAQRRREGGHREPSPRGPRGAGVRFHLRSVTTWVGSYFTIVDLRCFIVEMWSMESLLMGVDFLFLNGRDPSWALWG